MRPCPPAMPGVSPQPSSAPVAPLPTPASAVPSAACRRGPRRPPGGCLPTWQTLSRWQWRWGRAGEAASLGVLPRRLGTGTRLRSPGPGRRWGQPALPEQQREEMNNLGRPERPLPGAVGPGPPVRSVRPRHPESPKRCHLYLLSSWLGGFIFMCGFLLFLFFSRLSFFFLLFFSFFFSSCVLCVCVFCLSAGLGVSGVFLLALACHRKRGPGAGCAAPRDSRDEGAGRGKKSFLSQIPGLGGPRGTQRKRKREKERDGGSGSASHCPYPLRPPYPLGPGTSVSPLPDLA